MAAAAVVASLLLGWGVLRLWRIAAVGAAYKSKILCSALFVSGLDLDPQSADEVSAEAYRILRPFRVRVDRERRAVTASFLGLRARTAVFRPGLGCTLALEDGELPAATVRQERAAVDSRAPWPKGEAPAPAAPEKLSRVIEDAFLEKDPAKLRRTRAIVVVQDGKLLAERYSPGISGATPLAGWSMTKSVIGALVGCATGEGKLSVDQQGLLPEWRGAGDPRAEIRLEDLLRMRSGLRWAEVYADPLSDVVQMLFARPDAGGFAAAKPLASEPGTSWQYSSGTTNIVSLILRRALGEDSYPAFPRSALFEPLGMRSAVLEPDASGTFIGSSFMLATGRDWARFGQLYLQDGVWEGKRVLPEGWVAFSTTPTPQAPQRRFGAHWWLKCPPELGGDGEAAKRIPPDAYFALGHEGQALTVIPSRRLVVVRLGLSIRIDAWDHAEFVASLLDALGAD